MIKKCRWQKPDLDGGILYTICNHSHLMILKVYSDAYKLIYNKKIYYMNPQIRKEVMSYTKVWETIRDVYWIMVISFSLTYNLESGIK